jgi:hypothetical protein
MQVAECLFILANQFQKYDVTQVQDSRDSATNVLSNKSDLWTVGTCACGHTAPYQPTEFSTEGLRAYGHSFGANGASKYTKNHLFYCRISTLLQRPATIKILQGRSSLASLYIALNNSVIAILII